MELRILTWNGTNISVLAGSTVFDAWIEEGQMANLSSSPVRVPRAHNYPFLSTTQPQAGVFIIGVSVIPGNDIATKREILKQYFNFTDSQRHNLVAHDINDLVSPGVYRQYYLTGYPVRFAQMNINGKLSKSAFVVALEVESPEWRVVTALTDTWNITASGQTDPVTNIGNKPVSPIITITPTSAKTGGLSYRRWIPIYNNLDVTWDRPFDVTSGGFDTAALTTAKMQADGDDFRVWQDGKFADRWLNAMDSAATKAWINLKRSPRHEGTLDTALASAGTDVTVTFQQTAANKTLLEWLAVAPNEIFMIGTEAFRYVRTNVDIINYKITVVKRAQKTTSFAAHSTGDTIRHVESDIWMLYGDATLTAPDVDDSYCPMFDLDSTNAVLDYTYFYDTDAPRPAAWRGEVSATKSTLSYCFTGDENTFIDPSTELGMSVTGSPSAYNQLQETATLAWILSHPAGFSQVVYGGEKYAVNSFPAIAGLQYLQENVAWFTASNLDAPAATYTWEVFGPTTVALSTPYPTSIRFAMDGSLTPATGEQALTQFDTVSVTVDSTKLPTASIGAEDAVNFLDITLTNTTTGEYIKVQTPCKTDDVLTIDCETKRAYLSDGSQVLVKLSSRRDAWLDLNPGANTLEYVDVGTGNVTLVTTHRDRNA